MNNSTSSTTTKPDSESNAHVSSKQLRGSTLLLTGRVIAMALNFAIQVLIVRYLSKSDYGAFAYVTSLVSLGSSIAVLGLDKTVTRFLPTYQEKGEYYKLFGSILMMVSTIASVSFFLVVLVFGLQGWISGVMISDQLAVKLLLVMIFLTPIQALDSVLVGMLAIFVSPKAIFFRRHLLDPGLRLIIVFLLALLKGDVYILSIGYVGAGAIGVVLYSGILLQSLKKLEYFKYSSFRTMKFPAREIFSFSLPLLTTNFVYLLRHQLVVVMLGHYSGTVDVAAYRAVQPVSDLNTIVIQSFGFLFLPAIARMFARENWKGLEDVYWQSAIWIAIISLPIFLVTFSLAESVTLLLYGERYAQSGVIMALLSAGYYFNAALGFNADTLRIYGKLGYTVLNDFVAMLASLGLCLFLIPRYGAIGAAISTSLTLVVYNMLNQAGLKYVSKIDIFQRRYLWVYLSILLASLGLGALQLVFSMPIYVGVGLAGLISVGLLYMNRRILNVEQVFPELMRYKLFQLLFSDSSHTN